MLSEEELLFTADSSFFSSLFIAVVSFCVVTFLSDLLSLYSIELSCFNDSVTSVFSFEEEFRAFLSAVTGGASLFESSNLLVITACVT